MDLLWLERGSKRPFREAYQGWRGQVIWAALRSSDHHPETTSGTEATTGDADTTAGEAVLGEADLSISLMSQGKQGRSHTSLRMGNTGSRKLQMKKMVPPFPPRRKALTTTETDVSDQARGGSNNWKWPEVRVTPHDTIRHRKRYKQRRGGSKESHGDLAPLPGAGVLH